jgi:enoyl-[acyl-carrier-protein] reductase (NADH)
MLLSPVLRATTGTTIVVDGGTHLLGGAPHG